MERLLEDALHVHTLLPWIESDEDIVNFMRKIPLDKSHLRHQLTLHYFLEQKDSIDGDFEKQVEDDAREIVIAMPDTSYKEIKDRLSILGILPNRKEVVIRQLLHEKHDLDRLVKEISNANKRKFEMPHHNDLDMDSSNSEPNIKIKIFKREVVSSLSLEVSSSKKEEKASPSKNVPTEAPVANEQPSSSTSVISSTCQPDTRSPDSTVPSTSEVTNNNDPSPGEFSGILQEVVDSVQPSTSGMIMPSKCKRHSSVPSINNNDIDFTNYSSVERCREVDGNRKLPSVIVKSVINRELDDKLNNNDNIDFEPKFNLISFLQELTQSPERKIIKLCKKLNLDLQKRPSDDKLTYIVNELFEDVIEVKSDNSTASDSETEEYQLPAEFFQEQNLNRTFSKNSEGASKVIPETSTLSSIEKEFKLKDPVLVFNSKPAPAIESNILPKPEMLSSAPKPQIIKPARFNISNEAVNVIPAMPPAFLNRLDNLQNQAASSSTEIPLNQPLPAPCGITYFDNNDFPLLNLTNETLDILEAGPSNVSIKKVRVVDEKLVLKLIEMFPEACPDYIRDICDGKKWSEFDDVVTIILSNEDYPRRPLRTPSPVKEVDPEERFEIIKELLPDADPTYIRMQCEKYANNDKGLKEFIDQAVEMKNYPTMKDYLRRQQLSAQQKQYTTEFNIEHFVQLFPEPEKTFNDPKRTVKLDAYESHYLNLFFRNKFDKISTKLIHQVLTQNNNKIIPSNQMFENMVNNRNTIKTRRKPVPLPENMQNIPLLQELAYLSHKEEIQTYLKEKQKREEQERLEAKENGLMHTCQCCFDDEVMPKDTFNCPNGCNFCRDCIKKSCEVALGEGKTTFNCLANCSIEFALQTLQAILPPKMFSKLAQKKALAEIKAAGIEELEMCPFCDFATIPNEADKIFRCLNPDCMKESCRMCKEPNHVPLKCNEVEKDEDVKARTYIEDKMTEALIRKCWKCGTSFFKEEGCNKMTCSCGAQMCYICKKPVKDYTHFNGIGGDKFNLCPLYSNTNLINQQNVLGAAAAAKAEIDPSNLKVDPTAGIESHYKKRGKQLPKEPHLDLLNRNMFDHHHLHRGHQQHLPPHPHFHHPMQIAAVAQGPVDLRNRQMLLVDMHRARRRQQKQLRKQQQLQNQQNQ